ncbi:hypothetical protein BJV77DRAFT_184479 [Russula vinacea]|nr:hypothetical protein BJV77DRAFT_184479 [Russula vinacea]
MHLPPQCTLLNLSTELLIQILAYLQAADLFSVQRTCRKIRHIVAGTTYLQYILRTQINGVDDFLPPDFPYPKRLELLRRHEQSWNGLQFSLFAEFTTSVPQPDSYTLRDGYLIFEDLSGTVLRYGYTDLCSAVRNEEVPWVHITMNDVPLPLPSRVVFAVDHDLMVAMRQQDHNSYFDAVQLELAFFEFTTGAPHPLSFTHTVLLPQIVSFQFANVETEVLGDHILISVRRQTGEASFYLVSWKKGTVTLLRNLSDRWTPLWGGAPKLAVIDSDLIAVIKDSASNIEICKLEAAASQGPRLRTICFLELPPLTSEASCVLSTALKEWVPTSEHHARSSSSRKHHVPFYSSTVGTIALLLEYRTYCKGVGSPFKCTMVISVAAILSAIRSNVRNVSWEDWGPSGTRMFQTNLLRPAGPFWITDLSPLAVRDYNLLRTRCTHSTTTEGTPPSSHSRPPVSPQQRCLASTGRRVTSRRTCPIATLWRMI